MVCSYLFLNVHSLLSIEDASKNLSVQASLNRKLPVLIHLEDKLPTTQMLKVVTVYLDSPDQIRFAITLVTDIYFKHTRL